MNMYDPEVKAGSLLRTTGYSILYKPGEFALVLSVSPCRTHARVLLTGHSRPIRLGPFHAELAS